VVKAIQILGVLALLSGGIMLVHCAAQWFQGAPQNEHNPKLSIVEVFKRTDGHDAKGRQTTLSPLVRQAEGFALYLNPPAPREQNQKPSLPEKKNVVKRNPDVRPVKLSPKFELHGISYYRSKPEESMALVWEPGSGYRWIKQGEKLGHFVVEQIKSTVILYRDGQRTHEMAFVPGQIAPRVAQDYRNNLAPKESGEPERLAPGPAPPRKNFRMPPTRVAAKSESS
jgi:hypothetical protein